MSSKIVLVDVDGTVAIRGKRGPYEWDRVGEDEPNFPIIQMVRALQAAGSEIVFISGRSAICRNETSNWLLKNVLRPHQLIMRESNDFRPDVITKRELVERNFPDLTKILLVIDDRTQVVKMWRHDLGLTCVQVNDGNH